MGYPTSRRAFPSATRARALAAGLLGNLGGRGTWTGVRTAVRSWRPGRGNFLGLLAAYGILSMIPRDEQREQTAPMPDLAGWSNICGPFAHPGFPYGVQVKWRGDSPAPSGCDAPTGGQPGFDNVVDPVDRQLRMGWLNEQLLPLERVYVFQHYGRADAPAVLPRIRGDAPVVPVRTPYDPVWTYPPLTPTRPLPLPVFVTPDIPPPTWPQQGDRGYSPRSDIVDERPRDPAISMITAAPGRGTDARPTPWEKEVKVRPEFGVFFRMLGQYGSVNAIVNAMYASLPSWEQTASTQYQRNATVLKNLQSVDPVAFAQNAALWWVGYRAAAASIGAVPEALESSVGSRGFGLYRAWATGDFFYRGTDVSGAPVRRVNTSMQAVRNTSYSSIDRRLETALYRARARLRRIERGHHPQGGRQQEQRRLYNQLRRIRRRIRRRKGR